MITESRTRFSAEYIEICYVILRNSNLVNLSQIDGISTEDVANCIPQSPFEGHFCNPDAEPADENDYAPELSHMFSELSTN